MKINRIGEINDNNYGSTMVLEQYNGALDVAVRFVKNGKLIHTSYENFVKGRVRNPYDPTVCEVGYI